MSAEKSKDRVQRLKATTSKTMKSYSEPQLGPSSKQTSWNRGRGLSQRRSGGRRGGRSHDPDSDMLELSRKAGNTKVNLTSEDKSFKPIFTIPKIYLRRRWRMAESLIFGTMIGIIS
ncbi:hypothetical protein EVAR_41580_1 [Eumeta japonica]|uniref:Uncharacterized protein n=1 Tax=Eumeta variegata TaxID=151549 RepID=A0A4C1Y7L9_EUMVA|nr:hypothetical protein EVAR_41580_1 [Eumeta japonica]